MKKCVLPLSAALSLVAGMAHAAPEDASSRCVRALTGEACSAGDLSDPTKRTVVVLPTGFAETERDVYWAELERLRHRMVGGEAGHAWSAQKSSQLLIVSRFDASGPIDAADAAFGAKIPRHPVRGLALSLSQDAVYAKIDEMRRASPLHPFGALVLFNSFTTGVTANASPPSMVGKAFGVAKMTRADLEISYIATHELGHAALNYLDEYVEGGMESANILSLDSLTSLALFDGTWHGLTAGVSDWLKVYDYNLSEVLGNNGNVNIALSPNPSTVWSPGRAPLVFDSEGGMFFGLGTYKMGATNLMKDYAVYEHSQSQQEIIETAFGAAAPRANDRLRTAGPRDGWSAELGPTTTVMLADGDKLNHFHGTTSYEVEVGWYERTWSTCWYGWLPYPCSQDNWVSAVKDVTPDERRIDLRASSLYGLSNLVQRVACGVGYTSLETSTGSVSLCDGDLGSITDAFMPTMSFRTPYQEVDVPATQWMTTYWWRFRTHNGTYDSGFTGWSSFTRSL